MAQRSSSFESYPHALLRIMAGFVFALHGYQKVFGWFGGLGGHGRTASIFSLLWIAGVIESILGPFIIVGLFTRPIAFLLCGEMAVAYFSQHAPHGFWPIANGGELAVLYCFIFLFLVSNGAGPFSLDRAIRKKD
jgi:putative oxidoreductase